MKGKGRGRVLDRVKKLIALASSPNLEEARTAAFQACKLIREHELVVVRKEATRTLDVPSVIPKPDPDNPTVHLSTNGTVSACKKPLGDGVCYYAPNRIPTLRNVCPSCIHEVLGIRP